MYDTIIVGAGLAGTTAAIYASRKKMDFVLISKNFGGQLNMVGEVENFPFFKKTDWKELKSRLKEQVDYLGIELERERVETIEKSGSGFSVHTDENPHRTRSVIVATGAEARKLSVPGAARLTNRGVEYSVVSDAPKFESKGVAVVGGGDSAAEAADFLSHYASKIHIINIEGEMECQESLRKELIEDEKIEVVCNAETTEILGEDYVTGLKYKKDGKEMKLDVGGVFPAIGMQPQTETVEDLVELDKHGHIKIDHHCRTSVSGIFAAGDCTNIHQYQLAIAAGQGATALLKAAEYLRKGNE